MRYPVSLWGALVLIVLAAAGSAQAQTGYDRRGGDYLNFQIRNGDPAVCAGALRTRRALPRLELLLSAHGQCARHLLAEESVPPRQRINAACRACAAPA